MPSVGENVSVGADLYGYTEGPGANRASGESDLMATARRMIGLADVVIMDAAQDCRSDVGGFVTSFDDSVFEKLRNQVVVFEGLHTSGGMTGRAMEVFAIGIEEMKRSDYTEWYDAQVELLHTLLQERGVKAHRGTKAVGLDVADFLPHLEVEDNPKFTLSASLFIAGGVRARIVGGTEYHFTGEGRHVLTLELPRHALTRNHLEAIADTVATVHEGRD
ncbi:MAG: hypothetical protein GY704_09580, partial [Phycisphaeraceae bacterium]|nr:hypothetical protein [Phycisphaeraceae bacterium]